jgi:NAD(P)-dependent dehydrogenase (short-subunit alcohol dehydrogenase family)
MTEERFGPVSLLVSNAGVPGPFGPIWTVDPDAWWSSQRVHIRAPLLFLRQVMPGMIERRAGRIIIVAAVASRMVAPHLSAYCVGKIAQTRLAAQAAAEAKDYGVSVFAIDPGFVFTGIAEETMNSPDAQRWLPGMVARLREKQLEPDKDSELARCAQRCADLAAGGYDALSGRYLELPDDLEVLRRRAVTAPELTAGTPPDER